MTSQKTEKPNIVWHHGHVSHEHRCNLMKQSPKTLWLTGLSGAGKSTLAYALERQLLDMGNACYVLDGDNIRHGLNKDLGFAPHHRAENIRRVAEVAKLMNDAGLIVISAFISPNRADRDFAREIIGQDRFIEIYVSTPIEVCETRDLKGMYKKARAGEIMDFTGVSAIYEAPLYPYLIIDASTNSVPECVQKVIIKITDEVIYPSVLLAKGELV